MIQKQIILFICLLLPVSVVSARDKTKNKRDKQPVVQQFSQIEPDRLPQKALKGRRPNNLTEILNKKRSIQTNSREGIDVSHYQGSIDWDAVKNNEDLAYVYLKATEGASLTDDTYARNFSEAKRVGLMVGSYHFYSPNIDWRLQLQNMVTNVKPSEQDLVPIIDIENRGQVSDEQFISDLTNFINEVTRAYGTKPLLYSFHNFYNRHLNGLFKDQHWMIARYRSDRPTLDDGTDYIIWQYTSKGRIAGIRGNVDRSKLMDGFSLSQILM